MSELRVSDEMVRAGVRAMREHRFPDGNVGIGLTGIHAEEATKSIVAAALQAGGFTEEMQRREEVIDSSGDLIVTPAQVRTVGQWREVVSDGE